MQLPGQITDRDVPKTAIVLDKDKETQRAAPTKSVAEVENVTTNVAEA
jgi:hypothetical protein